VALVAVGAIWVVFDLYYPRQTDLRDFDAEQVGRLETAMWRSYYDRERLRLFMQLAELLRTQYRLPLIRSNLVAYQAAKAAFIFKDGRHRADYERALPNLLNFYAAIRRVSNISFDVERAAQLELEWWIIHRERHSHAPGELEKALADLSAEIYRVPAERLAEHARLRAEAMLIRDAKAEAGGVTEEDWARIDGLLRASWRALRQAVNS
jgi:transposase-like protein